MVQFTKLLDNTSIGQPLGSFLYVQYAGFDATNGQQLYFTADGDKVTQDALVIADKSMWVPFCQLLLLDTTLIEL
jgi:hypothetical protein